MNTDTVKRSSPRLPVGKPLPPARPARTDIAATLTTGELIRVERVAVILDISKKRVYQLVQEGRLEVVRLGPRQMRIIRKSLDQYLRELVKEEIEREP